MGRKPLNERPPSKPSEEEVQFRLMMMNRTENAAILTSDSARCKAIGITNYVLWFKDRGMEVQKKPNGVWELKQAPEE